MGGEHPPRAADRAGQLQHQIADLPAERRAAMGIVRRAVALAAMPAAGSLRANEIHDGRFLAAAAGNRHHVHHQRERFGVGDRHCSLVAFVIDAAIGLLLKRIGDV